MLQHNAVSSQNQAVFTPSIEQGEDTLRMALITGLADCLTIFEPCRKYALETLSLWLRVFVAEGVTAPQAKEAFEVYLMTGFRFPCPADVLKHVKSAATKHTIN